MSQPWVGGCWWVVGGGGGGYQFRNNSPTFWPRTAPGFAISTFTTPSFHTGPRMVPSNRHLLIDLFVYCFDSTNYCCGFFS